MPRGEFEAIARLSALFGADASRTRGVRLAIGDDAAVLSPDPSTDLVWTVDAQVDGRHFRRDWMTFEDIGWRSFVAAASDLAAMGAEPWCALSALGVPDDVGDAALDALARGQAEAARAVGCAIVGGNLSSAGELSVTTTLLGTVASAVRRGGAKPGDGVWLAGEVGLAALGLRALLEGRTARALEPALAVFRRPVVRIEAGRALVGRATAAIDVSDGLAQDAGHLAAASGVAVVLDEEALVSNASEDARRAAAALGLRPDEWVDFALGAGEGYALLATSPGALAGFTRIGSVEPAQGVWLRTIAGERRRVEPTGFDHFARAR